MTDFRVFSINLREEIAEDIFFYISFRCLTWDTNPDFTSNKPTHYLVVEGDLKVELECIIQMLTVSVSYIGNGREFFSTIQWYLLNWPLTINGLRPAHPSRRLCVLRHLVDLVIPTHTRPSSSPTSTNPRTKYLSRWHILLHSNDFPEPAQGLCR